MYCDFLRLFFGLLYSFLRLVVVECTELFCSDKKWGWPMDSPHPNAKDLDEMKRLVEVSRALVGLV